MELSREIEKSIIKKYRKEIWAPFFKGVSEYELIKEGDSIAVCISGGKDSMLLAKCMQELQKHGQIKFDLKFITMDPGYHIDSVKMIEDNAKLLDIPLTIFKSDIFEVVSKHAQENPCYMCARMRRGHLYAKAKELGCNKIALAHHYDDAIETILLNVLYNGSFKTMMPKLKSKNFAGLELIRPLYLVREEAIKSWVKYNKLTFLNCGCMITVCSTATKRGEIKELIALLQKTNSYAAQNIFSASENVVLNDVISYKENDEKFSFLDKYDD